jgi:membrane protease YdiL (CAAX protease family)
VPASARPGLSIFTIEGRVAPGLFVVGWLAVVAGFGLGLIGVLARSDAFFYGGVLVLTIGLMAGAGNQALERRARGATYAGPSPYLVLAAIVSTVIVVGAIVGFVLRFFVGTGTLPTYVVTLIGVTLQAAVYVWVLRLTVVGTGALSWRDMGWRRLDRGQLRNLLYGALIAIPVIALTNVVVAALVTAIGDVPESPLPPAGTNVGFVANLIAGAIVAPLGEEAVFRGFAMTAWERTNGPRGALVRASLVFAFAHVIDAVGGSFGQAVGLMVVGFVSRLPVAFALGWLFVRTRSIWAPIGLHMAFNGILLVLAEYLTRSGLA